MLKAQLSSITSTSQAWNAQYTVQKYNAKMHSAKIQRKNAQCKKNTATMYSAKIQCKMHSVKIQCKNAQLQTTPSQAAGILAVIELICCHTSALCVQYLPAMKWNKCAMTIALHSVY